MVGFSIREAGDLEEDENSGFFFKSLGHVFLSDQKPCSLAISAKHGVLFVGAGNGTSASIAIS